MQDPAEYALVGAAGIAVMLVTGIVVSYIVARIIAWFRGRGGGGD